MKNIKLYEDFISEGVNDLISKIKKDIENFRPGGDRGEITSTDNSVISEFRNLGNWVNNEEGHDFDDEDDTWREDDDQMIWDDGEYKKYMNKFKEWAKKYDWFDKVKLDLSTSEKSWCKFTIELK